MRWMTVRKVLSPHPKRYFADGCDSKKIDRHWSVSDVGVETTRKFQRMLLEGKFDAARSARWRREEIAPATVKVKKRDHFECDSESARGRFGSS